MRPNLDVNARRHEEDKVPSQMTKYSLKQQQDSECDANHRKGAHAPVIHDPVDHNTPEDDRRDGQHPEEQRTNTQIARDPSVAQQLPGNPAHPEWAVLVTQAVVAFYENDIA